MSLALRPVGIKYLTQGSSGEDGSPNLHET